MTDCPKCADPTPGQPPHNPSPACTRRPIIVPHCACTACFGRKEPDMTSIAELEHRLQLAQEEKAAALMHYKYREGQEAAALDALTKARIEQGEM